MSDYEKVVDDKLQSISLRLNQTLYVDKVKEIAELLQQAHAAGVREGLETAESENRLMLDMVRQEMERIEKTDAIEPMWKGGHYLACRHIEVKILERIEELKIQLRQKAEGGEGQMSEENKNAQVAKQEGTNPQDSHSGGETPSLGSIDLERYKAMNALLEGAFSIDLNMNDTFAFASADAESMNVDDFDELIPIINKYGHSALTAYVAIKRNEEPITCPCGHDGPKYQAAKKEIEDVIAKSKEWKFYEIKAARAKKP